jgi:hypothetical protein
MLHACVERFDVISGRENILGWDREVNKAFISKSRLPSSGIECAIGLLDGLPLALVIRLRVGC